MKVVEGLVKALRVVVGGILFPDNCHGEFPNRGMLKGSLDFFLLLCRQRGE
jgi:hypothetical protein